VELVAFTRRVHGSDSHAWFDKLTTNGSTQTVRPESFGYAQESLGEGLNQRFLLFTPVIV
jgi:hypothetical protein